MFDVQHTSASQHDGSDTRRMPAAFQVDGVHWLFRQWAQGMGGILADDMGERPFAMKWGTPVCKEHLRAGDCSGRATWKLMRHCS